MWRITTTDAVISAGIIELVHVLNTLISNNIDRMWTTSSVGISSIITEHPTYVIWSCATDGPDIVRLAILEQCQEPRDATFSDRFIYHASIKQA